MRNVQLFQIIINILCPIGSIVSQECANPYLTGRSHIARTIIQEKTKTPLTLPMPVPVGNAIYRYIKEGRPRVRSDYVFIRHKAPYGKLSNKTCTIALWSVLPERRSVHGGFHVTRRTFATNILRSGAGAGDVMDTLGHTDPTSVMKYLSMDEDRMRLCPLSLSDLHINKEGRPDSL